MAESGTATSVVVVAEPLAAVVGVVVGSAAGPSVVEVVEVVPPDDAACDVVLEVTLAEEGFVVLVQAPAARLAATTAASPINTCGLVTRRRRVDRMVIGRSA
jgi:hypothetical protein